LPIGGGEHILVVDDEIEVCDVLGAVLTRVGYQVTQHTNPLAALDEFGNLLDQAVIHLVGKAERLLGYRAIEVPVRWNDVAGTKVGTLSGLAAFLDPLRVRVYGWQGKYR
jgi:DNA-binding response OmpR family regulator